MANGFKQRFLVCSECGEEFVFTIQAQEYFARRGWVGDPRKCKPCHVQYRKAKRADRFENQVPDVGAMSSTVEGDQQRA